MKMTLEGVQLVVECRRARVHELDLHWYFLPSSASMPPTGSMKCKGSKKPNSLRNDLEECFGEEEIPQEGAGTKLTPVVATQEGLLPTGPSARHSGGSFCCAVYNKAARFPEDTQRPKVWLPEYKRSAAATGDHGNHSYLGDGFAPNGLSGDRSKFKSTRLEKPEPCPPSSKNPMVLTDGNNIDFIALKNCALNCASPKNFAANSFEPQVKEDAAQEGKKPGRYTEPQGTCALNDAAPQDRKPASYAVPQGTNAAKDAAPRRRKPESYTEPQDFDIGNNAVPLSTAPAEQTVQQHSPRSKGPKNTNGANSSLLTSTLDTRPKNTATERESPPLPAGLLTIPTAGKRPLFTLELLEHPQLGKWKTLYRGFSRAYQLRQLQPNGIYKVCVKTEHLTSQVFSFETAPASTSDAELHRSVLFNRLERCEAILAERPRAVNAVSLYGLTLLMVAAREGTLHMAAMLLRRGADVNVSSHGAGKTALMFAAFMGHIEIVEMLLAAGSSLEAVDAAGRSALHHAADSGSSSAVVRRLVAAGADLERKDSQGWTPLMRAVIMGGPTSTFIELGAYKDALDKHGRQLKQVGPSPIRRADLMNIWRRRAKILHRFPLCSRELW